MRLWPTRVPCAGVLVVTLLLQVDAAAASLPNSCLLRFRSHGAACNVYTNLRFEIRHRELFMQKQAALSDFCHV